MAYLQERNQIVKQVEKYRYIDGFSEIEVGLTLLIGTISSLIYIILYDLFHPIASNGFLAFIQIILLIIYINVPSFLSRLVKAYLSQQRKRVTSLRTGFIDFDEAIDKPTSNKTIDTLVGIGIALAVLAVYIIFISVSYFVDKNPSFSTLVSGLALLLIIAVAVITNLVVWYRVDFQHFYFYAVASLFLGCVLFVSFMQTKDLFKSLFYMVLHLDLLFYY